MYWSKVGEDHYELMDGQQRTISICRYAAAKDPKNLRSYEQCFSVDNFHFVNLQPDKQRDILDCPLDICVCDGTPSEILAWFKVINIAGKVLSPQELRNTSYTGPWLSDAKLYFSKPNCTAYKIGKDYMSGSPIRQEYLETAIKWIAARDDFTGQDTIEQYMALHQNDENANVIRMYFRRVIDWVQMTFPVKRKEMQKVEWGLLYNSFKDAELDPNALESEIKKLMMDDDVTDKKGVYSYVLTRDEKHLNIRAFTPNQKREAYERQGGVCSMCGEHFEIEKMHADHITPWSKGGKTISENCEMLCRDCNLKKGNI